jgi:hypothetical protein
MEEWIGFRQGVFVGEEPHARRTFVEKWRALRKVPGALAPIGKSLCKCETIHYNEGYRVAGKDVGAWPLCIISSNGINPEEAPLYGIRFEASNRWQI